MKNLTVSYNDQGLQNKGGHIVLVDLPLGFRSVSAEDLVEALEDSIGDPISTRDITVIGINDRRDPNLIAVSPSMAGMGMPVGVGYVPAVKPIFGLAADPLKEGRIVVYAQHGLSKRPDLIAPVYKAALENDPSTIVTGIVLKKGFKHRPRETAERVIEDSEGHHMITKWHVIRDNDLRNMGFGIKNAMHEDTRAALVENNEGWDNSELVVSRTLPKPRYEAK